MAGYLHGALKFLKSDYWYPFDQTLDVRLLHQQFYWYFTSPMVFTYAKITAYDCMFMLRDGMVLPAQKPSR